MLSVCCLQVFSPLFFIRWFSFACAILHPSIHFECSLLSHSMPYIIFKVQSNMSFSFIWSTERYPIDNRREFSYCQTFILTRREHVVFVCLQNIFVIVGVLERFLISNGIFLKCINKIQVISMQISFSVCLSLSLSMLFGEWAQDASSNELCLFNFMWMNRFGWRIFELLYVSIDVIKILHRNLLSLS